MILRSKIMKNTSVSNIYKDRSTQSAIRARQKCLRTYCIGVRHSDLGVLNFIEYELGLDQKIRVVELVLVVDHEEPCCIIGG